MKILDNSTLIILGIVIFGLGLAIGILLAMIAVRLGTNSPGRAAGAEPIDTKNVPGRSSNLFGNPNQFLS